MAGLTPAEAQFVVGVSQQTGIDPRVLIAWADAEGAYAQHGTGHFNYLNIRSTGSAGRSPAGFAWYSSPADAVAATARVLQRGTYAGIRSTVARPDETARDQIDAIAASPWDAGHYGGAGGPRLASAFTARFTPGALDTKAQDPSVAPAVVATVGTGSASDWTSTNPIGTATGAVGSAFGSVGDLIRFLFSYRFLELVGGLALLLVGLSVLSHQLGGPSLPLPGRVASIGGGG